MGSSGCAGRAGREGAAHFWLPEILATLAPLRCPLVAVHDARATPANFSLFAVAVVVLSVWPSVVLSYAGKASSGRCLVSECDADGRAVGSVSWSRHPPHPAHVVVLSIVAPFTCCARVPAGKRCPIVPDRVSGSDVERQMLRQAVFVFV